LGVSSHSLYIWVRKAKPAKAEADELAATKLENQKLKAELRRLQEERDILKNAARTLQRTPSKVRVHPRASSRAPGRGDVPRSSGSSQRLLRVAEEAPVRPGR